MSSSRSSVLDILALCALALVGCAKSDGTDEYREACGHFAARSFAKAEKLFQSAASSSPSPANALLMLSRTRIETGDIAGARQALDAAIAAAGDDALDAQILNAQLLYHEREYEASRAAFEKIAEDANVGALERAQAYSGMGINDMAMRGSDQSDVFYMHRARLEFFRAANLCYQEPSAHYHLAKLYRDAFEYREAALNQFKIFVAIVKDADSRVQKVTRSEIPDLKNDISKELSEIPGAKEADEKKAEAALKESARLKQRGRIRDARNQYIAAHKANPLSFKIAKDLAEMWLATDKTDNGKNKALDAYLDACRVNPNALSVFLDAGRLAEGIQNWSTAGGRYSRALAINQKSLDAIDGMIRVMRKTGLPKVAALYEEYRKTVVKK